MELAPPSQADAARTTTATIASACLGFSVEWLESRMIARVVAKRNELVASAHHADRLAAGRLLLSAYDYTHHDGATEHVTGGYLDPLDVPPWDTWVGELAGADAAWPPTIISHVFGGEPNRDILLSWVPREFIPSIDLALEEEVMGMLCWADDAASRGPYGLTFADIVPPWLSGLT